MLPGFVGAKAGQRGKPEGDRAAGRQRLALILFGALFVLLFVGFAVAQGLRLAERPLRRRGAVASVPDESANISEEEFDRALPAARPRRPES